MYILKWLYWFIDLLYFLTAEDLHNTSTMSKYTPSPSPTQVAVDNPIDRFAIVK